MNEAPPRSWLAAGPDREGTDWRSGGAPAASKKKGRPISLAASALKQVPLDSEEPGNSHPAGGRLRAIRLVLPLGRPIELELANVRIELVATAVELLDEHLPPLRLRFPLRRRGSRRCS